ncbi:Hypothetical protein AJAP_28170 [Amycolatopsis japonica]|uniref:Uncharacterized protein n=1 Tax=Amycolatopsis japonica TaxID=208439 RepID=A0A075UWB4_9PSEU|nr:hypothetical protein [Amycolatopsis japonica]AIG78472.1 Hypothetical protein AJAP_28170 [Amycolatopsis japonica]
MPTFVRKPNVFDEFQITEGTTLDDLVTFVGDAPGLILTALDRSPDGPEFILRGRYTPGDITSIYLEMRPGGYFRIERGPIRFGILVSFEETSLFDEPWFVRET